MKEETQTLDQQIWKLSTHDTKTLIHPEGIEAGFTTSPHPLSNPFCNSKHCSHPVLRGTKFWEYQIPESLYFN